MYYLSGVFVFYIRFFLVFLFGTFFLFYWITSINYIWDVFAWNKFFPSLDKVSFVNFLHEKNVIYETINTVFAIIMSQEPLAITIVEKVPAEIVTAFWSSFTNVFLQNPYEFLPEDHTGFASFYALFDMHPFGMMRNGKFNPTYPWEIIHVSPKYLSEIEIYGNPWIACDVDFFWKSKRELVCFDMLGYDIYMEEVDYRKDLEFWKHISNVRSFFAQ